MYRFISQRKLDSRKISLNIHTNVLNFDFSFVMFDKINNVMVSFLIIQLQKHPNGRTGKGPTPQWNGGESAWTQHYTVTISTTYCVQMASDETILLPIFILCRGPSPWEDSVHKPSFERKGELKLRLEPRASRLSVAITLDLPAQHLSTRPEPGHPLTQLTKFNQSTSISTTFRY